MTICANSELSLAEAIAMLVSSAIASNAVTDSPVDVTEVFVEGFLAIGLDGRPAPLLGADRRQGRVPRGGGPVVRDRRACGRDRDDLGGRAFHLVRRRGPRRCRHAPEQPQPLYRARLRRAGFVRELSAVPASLLATLVGLLGLADAWHVGARISHLLPVLVASV
jgi:hypothetical protein